MPPTPFHQSRVLTARTSLTHLVVFEIFNDYEVHRFTPWDALVFAVDVVFPALRRIRRVGTQTNAQRLSQDEMRLILKLMLSRVDAKTSVQGYKIEFSQAAEDHLLKTGFDPNYGARPLQRTIQRLIEDPLAEEILLKKFEARGAILVDYDPSGEGKITFFAKPVPVKSP